jgi:UDP-N-acetyl-D-mannosaminuronate dehydrogenase
VAQRLISLGTEVAYVDDHVAPPEGDGFELCLRRAAVTQQEVSLADLVVVLTDHDDVDYELVASHAKWVLDTRHRCRGESVEYL